MRANEAKARGTVRTLSQQELPSVFQPIVDLASGEVFGHEAFVRCTRTIFGSPVGLFEQAVRESATGALGRQIRQAAFATSPATALFVNLHPHELREPFVASEDDPITDYPYPVYLEITESATFDHHDLCSGVLADVCAETGAQLVVDDLGAGYSNLLRVIDLEPKAVKLDRAMITSLDSSSPKRMLVSSIVDLFRQLGTKVIGEGVETLDELCALRDCGVDLAQGYFLARPAAPPAPVTWPLR